MWSKPRVSRCGRALLAFVVLVSAAGVVDAAPGDIARFAGAVGAGPATRVAQSPSGLAVHDGALYVSDGEWHVIRRIDLASGSETVAVGMAGGGFSGDGGPATEARLGGPTGLAFDAAGNLLITDTFNRRIRRVDAVTGIISTIAGSDVAEDVGDGGPATAAGLVYPLDVAVAPSGDVFIADAGAHRVRRVDAATGIITTFAGTGEPGLSADGVLATSAALDSPQGVDIDAAGGLLIADGNDRRIRRVDANGTIGTLSQHLDIYGLRSVEVAPDGRVYAVRISTTYIVRNQGGYLNPVSGWDDGFGGDGGPASSARMRSPSAIAFDAAGNLFVADGGNYRVRRIDQASGIITTIAGNGSCCSNGEGIPARDAQIRNDWILGLDLSGNVLTVDLTGHRVRRIDVRTGIIASIAGSDVSGFFGDGGPATAAALNNPRAAVGDARGNVFIADAGNARIRRVDGATGVITTVAGNGNPWRSNDGALARTSPIGWPSHLALDRDGNLYFTEMPSAPTDYCSIRRIDAATGVLGTVVGSAGCTGRGDGGPALEAGLAQPGPIAIDPRGGLVFIDSLNVRRVDFATGIVERVFGNDDDSVFTPDGMPAAGGSIQSPTGVGVDSAGNVYVGESVSHRVRRIDAVTGLLSTAVGNGGASWESVGDGGPATSAELWDVTGVVVTHSDRIYVSEGYANRIRVVESSARCGDWTIDPGESCDDGNLVGGDCCSPTCTLASAGTVCRPVAGECDVAESCDGTSGLCPAPAFVASGSACSSDGNVCTDDTCNGNGACVHPNNTAPCNDGVFCNGADTCAGGTCRVHPGNPCTGGGECANFCDEARDTCNVVAGAPCTDDGSVCSVDRCDGSGSCTHPAANAGATCRASLGVCDVAEVCDGVSPTCPPDVFKPTTVSCRGVAGECDRAESCSGTSPLCPSDAFVPPGTPCTPDALVCTDDVCDGGGVCTHPAGNVGAVCRAAVAACDVAETCSGGSTSCPPDGFQPATVVCRGARGECDRAESCSGTSSLCPADAFVLAGTACTADDMPCTADVCDGSGACTHPVDRVGTVCRAAAGECDLAERCDGAAATCPADARRSAGTACGADGETCTRDVCDGSGVACTHPPGNAGAVCRAAAGVCDLAETCDGASTSCPADTGDTDVDDDGTCDAQDPCSNPDGTRDFASPPRSSVVLSRVNTDPAPGDDTLALTAFFALPEGRSFAELQPHVRGVRVVLEGTRGTGPLDATLPPGVYSADSRYGWKPSGSGKAWTYLDRRATPVSGIVKLTLTDRGRASTPRQVKVSVSGKRGTYPATPADLPLQAIVTLGDATDATAGLCAESAYAATSCAFNRAGNQLVCTR